MDRAFGRDFDTGEPPDQALADLTSTPGGVLALNVQDKVFNLKGKLMGIPTRTPAPVRQPLNAAFLVTIQDFVAGLAGDPKLPAEFRHRLAGEPASHKLQSLVHHRTLLPRHHSLPKKGKSVTNVSSTICHLCVGSLTQDHLSKTRRGSAFPRMTCVPLRR